MHAQARLPCATVLAAGQGRRMGGQPKAALRCEGAGATVLEQLAGAFRGAGVQEMAVVLGPYRDVLEPLARRCGMAAWVHALPAPTLVQSQRLALQLHADLHPGRDVLLSVADLPLLRAPHCLRLLQAWRDRVPGVQAMVPVVQGVPGHPLTLSWQAVVDICAQPEGLGVRHWLASHVQAVWRLPCDEPAYVTDIDTPEDLARLAERACGGA